MNFRESRFKKICVSAAGALALVTSLFPARAAPVGQPAAFERTPLKIVAFGSSSTEGVGATSPNATYPAQLQALLAAHMPEGHDVQVINRGIGGEDADDMMRRLRKDVISRHPDIVIWQTGSNDPMRNVPLQRFIAETRDGISAMRDAGIKVILMEPQWCPKLESIATSADYRTAIRDIGATMHVDVIRRSDLMHDWVREGLMTRRQMLAPDGLHMSDTGYAQLARSVAPEIMKIEDLGGETRVSSEQ